MSRGRLRNSNQCVNLRKIGEFLDQYEKTHPTT
jgi:hypothetical protein